MASTGSAPSAAPVFNSTGSCRGPLESSDHQIMAMVAADEPPADTEDTTVAKFGDAPPADKYNSYPSAEQIVATRLPDGMRVRTRGFRKKQLNKKRGEAMPFRAVPFRAMPFRAMPCRAAPCHATSQP